MQDLKICALMLGFSWSGDSLVFDVVALRKGPREGDKSIVMPASFEAVSRLLVVMATLMRMFILSIFITEIVIRTHTLAEPKSG